MYRTLKRLVFRFRRRAFEEQKNQVLSQLSEREWELRSDWLSNSANFLSLTNDKKIVSNKSRFLVRQLKNIGLFFSTFGLAPFISLLVNPRIRGSSSIKELKSLESRRKEIEEAKNYFQKIQDNEQGYARNKEKELEPWSEEIVSYSLTSMPFSKYEEIIEKKNKDPYIRFLHIYAIVIAFLFTGGFITFYWIFKKSRDPQYRFLDSALTKHVVEGERFEKYLTELIRQKYEFDSIHNINYCLKCAFREVALSSTIQTKFLRKPSFRNIFFFVVSILSGGLFPMYIYWLSMRNESERFNKWWALKRTKEWNQIESLSVISAGWLGRSIKFLKKLWSDLHIFSYIASTAQLAVATVFLKPFKGIWRINNAFFNAISAQSNRKAVNSCLLLISFGLITIWGYAYDFDDLIGSSDTVSNGVGRAFSWAFYALIVWHVMILSWFGWDNYFRKHWVKLYAKLGKAWAELLAPKPKRVIRAIPASNFAMSSQYFKPPQNLKTLNWGLFWMFSSPLSKWMVNLLLLLLSYAFLLVWSFIYKFDISGWPFYTMLVSSSLFLLLFGYHIYLVV